MAGRFCLLVLDNLDRFRERGAAANVAPLVIAIVITGGVAQHVVERIWPDLCALPICVHHQISVHRRISFLRDISAFWWVIAASLACYASSLRKKRMMSGRRLRLRGGR